MTAAIVFAVLSALSNACSAVLFGAATAVVWSVDAAFVKQAVDVLAHSGPLGLLTGWPLYAVIATGVLGTVLLQAAYAAGPLAASQATLLIVDPLASIALGIELCRCGPVVFQRLVDWGFKCNWLSAVRVRLGYRLAVGPVAHTRSSAWGPWVSSSMMRFGNRMPGRPRLVTAQSGTGTVWTRQQGRVIPRAIAIGSRSISRSRSPMSGDG